MMQDNRQRLYDLDVKIHESAHWVLVWARVLRMMDIADLVKECDAMTAAASGFKLAFGGCSNLALA